MSGAVTLVALLAALAAGAPASERIDWLERGQSLPRPCDVEVSFGSYASGTNSEAARKVRAYVQRSRDVTRAQAMRWGREGEWDLCLTVRPQRTARVYADIRRMIPKYSRYGPTRVTRRDGASFESRWPK